MNLTVLVDNNTYIDRYYIGEPALSFYIEDGNDKILFDTGYSDVLLQNARAMNIDLDKISTIVISHGHNDHTGGLTYVGEKWDISNGKLVAHPDAFKEKWYENEKIGAPFTSDQMKNMCKLSLSKSPEQISDNIVFLGEIPKMNEFEHRKVIGSQKDGRIESEDLVLDDSAIVYKSESGLFLITGCSHSGICNMLEYAKEVCREDKILGVIGGFHLFERDIQLQKTIQYMKVNQIKEIYPCHCVSFQAKAEMNQYLPITEVGVGLSIKIK